MTFLFQAAVTLTGNQAAKQSGNYLRTNVAGGSSGSIGVGNQLFHYKYQQDHSNCLLCQERREKVSHVLHCTDQGATTHTLHRIEGPVKKTLDDNLTDPVLSEAILDILTKWRLGTPILPIHYNYSVRSAVHAQRLLGWHYFVLGFWVPEWRHVQVIHYKRISSKKLSLRWATAVIHRLFLTAWDMWQ